MTPNDIRRAADILESEESGVLDALFTLLAPQRRVRPMSPAERSATYRARHASRDAVTVSPTPPSDRNGDIPESHQEAKTLIVQKNPENQKDLPDTASGRARGAKRPSRNERDVTPNVVAGRRAGSWRRFPPDYVPDEAMREFARALRVDLDAELAKIRDFEFGRPRRDAAATLRNWLRTASERPAGPRPNGHANGAPNPVLARLRGLA